jgi:magnesium transporter
VAITWVHLDSPSDDEATELLVSISQALGRSPHEIVRKHFERRRTDPAHAFPRLESHFGKYLFGHLYLPTSVDDGIPDFAELMIVSTFTECWTVLRLPEGQSSETADHQIIDEYRRRIEKARECVEESETCGVLLGRLLTVTVSELENALTITGLNIEECVEKLSSVNERHLNRAMKDEVPVIRKRATTIRHEVASLGTVVDELDRILQAIVDDQLDLHRELPDGTLREVFNEVTEIHLRDTQFRSRRLRVLHDEQLEQLQFVFDTITHLSNADEVISGRFMGAIASIMLMPTFIVGLYGMNFESMPELHWPGGYGFAVALIALVTVFQVWFFRRRRWL